jgi:kynurenine formamidase
MHDEVTRNVDYTLTVERLKKWETEHGCIPAGAFVAMRTDWSKRWPDSAKMENKDDKGVAHYPGVEHAGAEILLRGAQDYCFKVTRRSIRIDPGTATTKDDYSLEAYILSHDHYQIELLTNLDQLSESVAITFSTFSKPKRSSGFPARVFAIEPN